MVLNQEAMMIFAIIDGFLRGGGTARRSPVLENFPQSFHYISLHTISPSLQATGGSTKLHGNSPDHGALGCQRAVPRRSGILVVLHGAPAQRRKVKPEDRGRADLGEQVRASSQEWIP
ncbi:unnamed protein product [Urochloa humidicola]